MTDSVDSAVLAVDGGGTRCRFAFVRGGDVLSVEGGPANAFSNFAGTVTCLHEGLAALAGQADMTLGAMAKIPAFVGLAGVTGQVIADRLADALPLENLRIADDRPAALRGAMGEGDGVLAHCGTGSFLAAQMQGQHRLAGGWGAVLGDEASAQWIGRKALATCLRASDGFLSHSDLTRQLAKELGGTEGVLRFVSSATPETLGALAPQVTKAATQGDPIATKLMQAGAAYLAEGLGHMGWVDGTPICLTGGIGPSFAPYMPDTMKADLAQPLGSPLDGAIALARALAKELANEHC